MEIDIGSARPLEGIRVLIVEDNAPLSTIIARFLQGAGCTVLEAGTPGEALAAASAETGRIDVALVDLVLPEMSGPECADLLKESRPELAIAYMSGYAESVSEGFPEDDTPVLLAKPFAREELVSTIRSLLGRAGPAAS
ncbi:MAG: response regulator [Gemmatimonadaceae bacterium]|nr:response regulator [Gemmatimonadaceae bacterium]